MTYAVINPNDPVYKTYKKKNVYKHKTKLTNKTSTKLSIGDTITKKDGRIALVVDMYQTGKQNGKAKLECMGCKRNITANTCPCVIQTHHMHTDRLFNRRTIMEPCTEKLNQLCIEKKGCDINTLHKHYIEVSGKTNIIELWGNSNGYSCDHIYGGCNFNLNNIAEFNFVTHYKNLRIISNKIHIKKSAKMNECEIKFIKSQLNNGVSPESLHNKLRMNAKLRLNTKITRLNRAIDQAKQTIQCKLSIRNSIIKGK